MIFGDLASRSRPHRLLSRCSLADLESSIIGLPPFHLPHMDTFVTPPAPFTRITL